MTIQKTAAPTPIDDLFAFYQAAYTDERAAVAKERFGPGLWPQLATSTKAPWPLIEGASVSIGRTNDGIVFVLETTDSILAIGAVGDSTGLVAWQGLTSTVSDLKKNMLDEMRKGDVDVSKLQVPGEPEKPADRKWIVVVPLVGLRYYAPDKQAIIGSLVAFGHYLLSESKYYSSNPAAL